jgi:hypothetical protein
MPENRLERAPIPIENPVRCRQVALPICASLLPCSQDCPSSTRRSSGRAAKARLHQFCSANPWLERDRATNRLWISVWARESCLKVGRRVPSARGDSPLPTLLATPRVSGGRRSHT